MDAVDSSDNIIFKNNVIEVPKLSSKDIISLGHEYFWSMKKYKNKIAQHLVETGQDDTYADLLLRCVRTALHIRDKGFTRDNIICLCSYNHLNSCVPYIGGLFLGMQLSALDPSLPLNDTTVLLQQLQPGIIFVVPEALELIEKATSDRSYETRIVVFGDDDQYDNFDEYLKPHLEESSFEPVPVASNKETAIILCSSGTTGLPKGICQNHYAIYNQVHNLSANDNVGDGNILYFSSLYWISGVLLTSGTIFMGGTMVVCKQFDPKRIWHLIDEYKIKFLFLSPTGALHMLKTGRPDGVNTTSLITFVTGGGPLAAKSVLALRDLLPGTFISLGYGQSEVAGLLTIFSANKIKDSLLLDRNLGSCGRPVPGVSYKVVDLKTNKVVGPNCRGELCVKTEYVMNGYYKLDSSQNFDSDGFLKTGDIAYYDDDYCFYIVDRIKEMLKYKSWHVAPASVEGILDQHPAVQKGIVIGIPDEEDGDHIMAVVTLNQNYNKKVSPEDIEKFVNDHVEDRQKIRAGVLIVDSFPTTPSGKVKRFQLRELILNKNLHKK